MYLNGIEPFHRPDEFLIDLMSAQMHLVQIYIGYKTEKWVKFLVIFMQYTSFRLLMDWAKGAYQDVLL